jgi:hypothetical protein
LKLCTRWFEPKIKGLPFLLEIFVKLFDNIIAAR